MATFDLQIGWLHKHKACAEDALRDLRCGRKVEIDEKDVTQEWIAIYEQIIAKYRELIVACKARGPLNGQPNLGGDPGKATALQQRATTKRETARRVGAF